MTGFHIKEMIPIKEDVEGRYGTPTKQSIKPWFSHQKMHFYKADDCSFHQEIGYIIKAIKI